MAGPPLDTLFVYIKSAVSLNISYLVFRAETDIEIGKKSRVLHSETVGGSCLAHVEVHFTRAMRQVRCIHTSSACNSSLQLIITLVVLFTLVKGHLPD